MQLLTAADHLSPKKHFSFAPLFLALLAVFIYFYGLGSDHLATNGDELLYAQIVRATAESGHWLPLQSPIAYHRNTKPPLLFWQGMISTDWGKKWSLFNLRWPNVVYTLLTAFLVFLLAKRLSRQGSIGLLAALIFLSFFGTFRYGRCFLTSAPEVFWLFFPLFLLIQWPRSSRSWKTIPLSGCIIGMGLLYKSFALIVPVAAGKAWCDLHTHSYDFKKWLRHDAIKLFVIICVALSVFSLWFLLDPHPQAIFHDFIIRENLGKFETGGGNYFWNFLIGSSSIWRNVIAYPLNAGLLAPALLALFAMTYFHRKELSDAEALLWIWVTVIFLVFSLPNQRDERYLLLGMPALAVLLALHWEKIPRWTLVLSLIAVFVISAGLAGLALLLEYHLASPIWHFYHYPITFWAILGMTMGTACYGFMKTAPTRALVCPCILLLYLCYAAFLSPFDGPLGQFDQSARNAIYGKRIWVPVNFNAREESYRFLLPESAALFPYDYKTSITIQEMKGKVPRFIVSFPLTDQSSDNLQGARLLGRRLNLIDRFNAQETQAILMGNIAPYLFHQDLLIER